MHKLAPDSALISGVIAKRTTLFRYGVVSGVNVVNHQLLLALALSVFEWGGGVSNVFAAVIAAVPGYLLSRYWVWAVRGTNDLRAEIIPFWTLALLGLVVSTVMAEAADRAFEASIAVMLASLIGYFVVWVLKFLVLNRIFERSARRNDDVPVA